MTIGKKIASRRKELGLTLEEVGNAVGVGKSTVKKWESGYIANMRRDKIAALAKVLQMSPSEFISSDNGQTSADDELFTHPNIFPIHTKRVPLLGSIACGKPIFANEEHGEFVLTSDNIDADFCLRAEGDSMTGARIFEGDIVFIRKQDEVENGQIAAVLIGDKATLKRVYYYPEKGKLILNPENPTHEPQVYIGSELDEVHILGLAVAFQSVVR